MKCLRWMKTRRHLKAAIHTSSIFTLCLIFTTFLINQCASDSSIDSQKIVPIVGIESILPKYESVHIDTPPREVTFPAGMLAVAQIKRPNAEMRVGPGTQFKLKDRLLSKGDQIVLLERVGAWQKVVALEIAETGWVHNITLGRIRLNNKQITLQSELLPRVFAMRRLQSAFQFARNNAMTVPTDIPKGQSFIAVRYEKRKVLVYVPSTNSVAWFYRGVVQ